MRCSGGVAHASGPLREPGRRDHHYASIEFDSRAASRKALAANNKSVVDATGTVHQRLIVGGMVAEFVSLSDLVLGLIVSRRPSGSRRSFVNQVGW